MRRINFCLISFVLFATALLAFARPSYAQANLGSVQGQVQDKQHAAVPDSQLTLTNEQTAVAQKAVSGSSGTFSFLNITPGTYTLAAEAKGFAKSVQQHIIVGVGTAVTNNVVLSPGQVAEVVTVEADAAHVDTETSEIGTTITPGEIKDLPVSLNADMRNPLNFVVLTPGVAGSEPGSSPDYRLHFSGSVSYADEVYIDGVPIMETNLAGNITNNHPPIDAISEFRVINNNQTAQYGLASGIVSFAFASGTNSYHGSLFEFLQNDALDAAGYVTDALGLKKAPLKQNEFGGTFGGPVRIPGLYKGRDKTFFFFDYTEFRFRPSANNATLTTYPTPFRTGNFSALLGPQVTDPASGMPVLDPAGRPIYAGAIYNPFSVHTVVGPDGNSYQVRDPFPGNIVPSGFSGLSAVSQTILNSFPTASSDALEDNVARQQSSQINEHRMVIKIDEHINPKHSISGSFFSGGYSNANNGGLNLLDAIVTSTPTLQGRLSYNYNHSATLLNNLNLGVIRDTGVTGPVQPGPGFAALGITGLPPLDPGSFYPGIQMGTVQNSIGSNSGIGSSYDYETRYFLNDNLTLLRGHHIITFGGEGRYLQRNEGGFSGGYFDFANTETALNGTGFINGHQAVSIPSTTGDPRASFLFGATDFSYFEYPAEQGYRWWQTGEYLQDDWKVRPNLTLNLGLRYDLQIPRTETHGNVSTLDPTLANPAAGGLPGAYTFYGTGPGRNGLKRIGNIYPGGIQPRIGFAYSPGTLNRTAIRGGFAMTRPIGNDNNESGIGGTQYDTGYAGLATVNRPGDEVGSPAYYWDSAYPASSISGQTLNPGLLVGNDNPAEIHPSAGMPPTQFYWTTQLQQQMSGSVVFSLAYVGMHTYHLGIWSKPNQIDSVAAQAKYGAATAAAGLPLAQFLLLPVTDPRVAAAGITPPWPGFQATFGSGATAGQAIRPFPQYGDIDNPLNPIGSVSYNGLQTSLQKRLSHGLTFLLSYTFSKTIGDVDSGDGPAAGAENGIYAASYFQDYYNPRAQRAVTSSDIPQVVTLSYTYQLPVGRGKPFLNRGGVLNEALGGWSVSGIQQYQSGRPIHIEYDSVGAGNPFFEGDGYSFRPNLVPGQPLKNPLYRPSCSGPVQSKPGRNACQFYINPAAFSAPAIGQFGNAPNYLGNLRMPGYLDEDLSASKRFTIFRESDLQFQANFFNAFNRVVFGNGGGGVGNATTFIYNYAPPNLSAAALANSTTVFGIMAAQQNAPRIIQFGLRLEF